MDPAYLSALAALAGTTIGGLTSLIYEDIAHTYLRAKLGAIDPRAGRVDRLQLCSAITLATARSGSA